MADTLTTEVEQQEPPTKKLGVSEFAAKIKAKYPDYAGIDDSTLVQKILQKYPTYSEQVDTSSFEKKNPPKNGQENIYSGQRPSSFPLQSTGFASKVQLGLPESNPNNPLSNNPLWNMPQVDESKLTLDLKGGKVPESVKDYNKAFENITGVQDFNLKNAVSTTGSTLDLGFDEKRKNNIEEQKYKDYKQAEEGIKQIQQKIYYGAVKPEELQTAMNNDYSKRIIGDAIAPFLDGENIEEGNIDYSKVADKIFRANKKNAASAQQVALLQEEKNISGEMANLFPDLKVDFNDTESISNALQEIKGKYEGAISLKETEKRVPYEERRLLPSVEGVDDIVNKSAPIIDVLQRRLMYNQSLLPISNSVQEINDKIDHAVISNLNQNDEGNRDNVADDETKQEQFKLGLSYLEKGNPGLFKAVTSTLKQTGKIAPSDFYTIANTGQAIYNQKVYTGAPIEGANIPRETNFDYTTREQRKSDIASVIGEVLKNKQGGNGLSLFGLADNLSYSEDEIKNAAKDAGIDPNNDIVKELITEEKLFGYDAIPKSGFVNQVIAGGAEVIKPSVNFVSNLINKSLGRGETTGERYLRTKSLSDIQSTGQQVTGENAEVSTTLPSERKISTDIYKGLGQFAAQVLLTKGVGAPLEAGTKGLASVIGKRIGANAARGIVDYGGTYLSMFGQSYDSSYDQYLQSTGDEAIAQKAGFIDANIQALTELILPDVKIARRGVNGLREGLVSDLQGLVKKGGDVSILLKESRKPLEKFISGYTSILATEIGEEEAGAVGSYLNRLAFDPNAKTEDSSVLNDAWDVAKSTALSMALPALFGAGGGAFQEDFTQKSLHHAAINIDDYKTALESSLAKNYISQDNFNKSVQLLNTHRESLQSVPEMKADGRRLTSQEDLDYALETTKIKYFKDKQEKAKTAPEKEMYDSKIKESENIQRNILSAPKAKNATQEGGEGVSVIPPKTQEEINKELPTVTPETKESKPTTKESGVSIILPQTVEKGREMPIVTTTEKSNENVQTETNIPKPKEETGTANEETNKTEQPTEENLLSQAKDLVNNDVVKGYSGAPLKDAAKNDPEQFNKYLKNIAEQANDPKSNKATIDTYGKELVGIAQKLNPETKIETKTSPAVENDTSNKNEVGNFEADLSDSKSSLEEKMKSVDNLMSKYGVESKAVKPFIEKAIERAKGISVNSVFDIAKRISENDGKPLSIEHIAEALNYEMDRVAKEKDAFTISTDDVKDAIFSHHSTYTPANKERKAEIGLVDKSYQERLNLLNEVKGKYENLDSPSKSLVKTFLDRMDEDIREKAKLNTDEYISLVGGIVDGKTTPDVAENISKAITKIDNKEAIELRKQKPIKEPLLNEDNTEQALRRFQSSELSKINVFSRDEVGRMISDMIKKRKEASINLVSADLYNLPEKAKRIALSKDGSVSLYDKNDKKVNHSPISKERFEEIAYKVGNNQRKDAGSISRAYHKAKADGSNPELVKAVEDLLGNKAEQKTEKKEQLKEEAKPSTNDKAFITHTGEKVSGKRLTDALNKVADDWAEMPRNIRSEDKYASHVTEKQKEENLSGGLKYAQEIREGKHLDNLTIAQRIDAELTGETVPLLPKPEQKEQPKEEVKPSTEKPKKEKKIVASDKFKNKYKGFTLGDIQDADLSKIKTDNGSQTIGNYISKAKLVLNQLFPDATFETYNTHNEFEKAGGVEGSRGTAITEADGSRRILLNLKQMEEDGVGKTAFHEVIHPIVAETFGKTPEELAPIWNEIVNTMRDVEGMDKVWSHIIWYSDHKTPVEGITEFLTQVADGNINIEDIPAAKQSKLIDLINRLFEKLGIGFKIEQPLDLKKFATDLKNAFETGDVSAIKETIDSRSAENKNATENASKVSNLLFADQQSDKEAIVQNMVKDVMDEGFESLDDIKEAITNSLGIDSPAFRKMIEDAYEKVGKNVPPKDPINSSDNSLEDDPPFTLIKSNLEVERERLGMAKFEGTPVSNQRAMEAAISTMNKWKEDGVYNKEINKILDDAMSGDVSDEGQNILAQHIVDLQKTMDNTDRYSSEYDKLLRQKQKAIEAGDILRSAAGRILGRKLPMRGNIIENVSDVEMDMMDDNVSDTLTKAQKEEAQKRFDAIKEKLDKETELRQKAEDEIARLKAAKKVKEEVDKNRAKVIVKTKEDYIKERTALKKSIKEKWKNAGNNMLSSDIPYRKQLAAIAPDVARLMKSYIQEGAANTLEGVKRLLKKDLEEDGIVLSDGDIRKLIAGEFNNKKQGRNEIMEQLANLRHEQQLMNEIDRLENGDTDISEKRQKRNNARIAELNKRLEVIRKMKGVGRYSEESQNEAAQKAALKSIADLENKISNNDLSIKKAESLNETEKTKELRQRQSRLRAELEEKRKSAKIGKYSDEAKNEVAQKAIQKNIDELENRIKDNDLEIKKSESLNDTEKTKSLRQRQDELRKELEEKRKQAKSGKYSDESKFTTSLKQRISANKKEQGKLEEKLKNKDYDEEVESPFILDNKELQQKNKKLYDEYLKSIVDKEKALVDYEKARIDDKMANRDKLEKLGHYLSVAAMTSKGTVAMFDQSVFLVQMLPFTLSHPVEALKFARHGLQMFANPIQFEKNIAILHNSRWWDTIQRSELAVYEPTSAKRELRNELHGGEKNLLNKDIIIGKRNYSPGQAFERSTSTLLNDARIWLFMNRVSRLQDAGKTIDNAPEEYKAAARVINELTGHGKPHQAFQNDLVNQVIWSTKMFSSTLNLLGLGDLVRPISAVRGVAKNLGLKVRESDRPKGFYTSLTPTQGKFVAKEMTRFIANGILTLMVIKILRHDDDDTEVDFDPRSSSFGAVKVKNKTYPIFGRFGSAARTIVQSIITGEKVYKGKVTELGVRYGSATPWDVFFKSFVRGKATPLAGTVFDYFGNNKKNYYTKEEMDAMKIAQGLVIPMSLGDIPNNYIRDGFLEGTVNSLLSIYGLNAWDDRDFKITTKPKRKKKTELP